MKIVIVGAGKVGYAIAEQLLLEGHDITVIESDPTRAEYIASTLDVIVVEGKANVDQMRIANVGSRNLLQIIDGAGARSEYYPDFLSRWHQAYINEIAEFVACIRDGRKPEVTVYDGTAVSRAAYACKESFESGEMLSVSSDD